ncbi:ABC transporter permease [Microbacterium hominis]|uniref:ABC transporter permease n=1 Tax=Microbacterium hominis TaxID=162426 RepID=A0A7D4UIA8_9MICO|nr:ABC transporter permease [Microbacterium hominis]QKJ18247.1 ABC transporter permease [Microbacterium hominis]
MTTVEQEDRAAFQKQRVASAITDIAGVLVTIVIALALAFIIIAMLGKNPVDAFAALITGPLERPNRIGNWIEQTTTLTILGLSVMIPFRTGQISIGAEGQLYLGALAGAAVAIMVPMPLVIGPIVAVVVAMLAGGFAGAIPGVMKARLGANEIVATLMLNVIIVQIFEFLVQNVLRSETATAAVSDPIRSEYAWPKLQELTGIAFSRSNIGILIAILLAVGVWFLMSRTTLGYRMRIVGGNPEFATYAGLPVARTIEWSFILGGALAGLAGAHLVFGVFGRLEPGMATGLAFLGIVIALLGRNNPIGVVLAAAFYGYLRVGGDVMEQQTDVGSELIIIIQAVIVLLVTAQALPMLVRRIRAKRKAA